MVYGKLPSILLFSLASIAIIMSGFQCATRVGVRGRGVEIPINRPPGNQPQIPPGGDDRYSEEYLADIRERERERDNNYDGLLPAAQEDSRCSRAQLKNLEYGAMANFEFDSSSLKDFLLGQSQNFSPICGRLYLDMSKMGAVYKGSLSLALQTSANIKTFEDFNSGHSNDDNRYNKWTGTSWRADRTSKKVDKQFHAIYEDQHSAVILKLTDVWIVDVRDGVIDYIGDGELYYKMFHIATVDDVQNTKGSCYSEGAYISQAHRQPPKRNRCWFITVGPYNCRPSGSLNPNDKFTDIDITANNYKCFSRLGRFWNLNIEEAFNDAVEDL